MRYSISNTAEYGDYQVGDKIVLICDATTNADGDVSYTVVDYVEY